MVCWRSCYKTTFLRKNNLYFNEDFSIAEDILFNIRLLLCVEKIIDAEFLGYIHKVHENSFCATAKGGVYIKDLNEMSYLLYSEISQKGLVEFENSFPYIHHYLINAAQMFFHINKFRDLRFYARQHLEINKDVFYKK